MRGTARSRALGRPHSHLASGVSGSRRWTEGVWNQNSLSRAGSHLRVGESSSSPSNEAEQDIMACAQEVVENQGGPVVLPAQECARVRQASGQAKKEGMRPLASKASA